MKFKNKLALTVFFLILVQAAFSKKEVGVNEDFVNMQEALEEYPSMEEPTFEEEITLFKESIISDCLEDLNAREISAINPVGGYSKEELQDLLSSYYNMDTCNYVYDGNEEAILNMVKDNSRNYAETHEGVTSIFEGSFSVCTPELFLEAFHKITTESCNDISEDVCRIKDMKIVFGSANSSLNPYDLFTQSYLSDDNVLVLDMDAILAISNIQNISLQEGLRHAILHGLNSARMIPCSCTPEKAPICNHVLLQTAAETELYYTGKDRTDI